MPPVTARPLAPQRDAPRLAVVSTPLLRLLHGLDEAQAQARIDIWRASDAGFAALLANGEPAAAALRRLALAHWTRGNPRLAAVQFATAVALAPEAAEIWLDLGGALRAGAEPEQARLAFDRSLALDPAPARGWLALGLVANELGDRIGAETAFAAALERDPDLGEAAFGHALVAFDARRYADAAARFRRARDLGAGGAFATVGLGQSLFFLGDFAGAADELAAVVTLDPNLAPRAALARYLACALAGDFETAERRYQKISGRAPDGVARTAFQILSAYGQGAAALALAQVKLGGGAGDPELSYLVAAVAGEKLTRAPENYLVAHFDAFAEDFDAQLVGVLGYRGPDELMDIVESLRRDLPRALDLGCGTGLAGPRLRQERRRLVGVDLSSKMLAKAAERGVYDELIEAELLSYLRSTSERFDLVLAADTLVYLGDLAPFFAAAARATVAGSLIAFNIETLEGAPYRLQPSGRFAHNPLALPQMAGPWFRMKASLRATLRSEADRKVEGAYVIMERRGTRRPPAVRSIRAA